jgi:hypothetical protein
MLILAFLFYPITPDIWTYLAGIIGRKLGVEAVSE